MAQSESSVTWPRHAFNLILIGY